MARKGIATFGAAGLALAISAGCADAKSVRYEIDGQPYTYSTNNREQTEAARLRIKAAEAATAAKAKAEAELASNPLVRMIGSQTQTAAAEAQAHLQQVMAAPGAEAASKAAPRRAAARDAEPATAAPPRRRTAAASARVAAEKPSVALKLR